MADYIWIDCEKIRESERAVLLETDEGEQWCPKSQIGAHNTDWTRVEVTAWWATEHGLHDPRDER